VTPLALNEISGAVIAAVCAGVIPAPAVRQ